MALPKFLRSLPNILLYCSLGTMLLVVLPGLPPYISFKSFKTAPSRSMEGKLAPNYILDKAELFVEGKFLGAESHAFKDNVLYTAVDGGNVLKIEDHKDGPRITVVGQTNEPCAPGNHSCGRPLGIRVDSKGQLIVAEGFDGIVSLDPKSGARNQYFPMKEPIEGVPPKFPDDLDVAKDGTVYWSDLSAVYGMGEFSMAGIGDNTGRLIKYDPKTKKNTVLISGMFAANGVQLSEKEDFVLVNEFNKARTLRYYLKGPKAGTHDVFLDGLPGCPDNVRPNGRGGFFIALCLDRIPVADILGPLPQLRKLLVRLQWFALTGISLVERIRIFNSESIANLKAYVENFGSWGFNWSSKPSLVETDGDGNILGWYKAKNIEAAVITQFTAGNKYLYFSSIMDDKIWRIKMSDLRK